MNNQKVYMIDSAMYEDIVRERVMLYSFIRQIAFQARRLSSQREICHLQELAHLYGEQAEEMFGCWDIPKRFLAFGDPEDLAGIKRIELLDYDDDWEEDSSECQRMSNPKVVVMDLEELLAKLEAAAEADDLGEETKKG